MHKIRILNQAFTLIEIIAVVVILAIIAAFAIPNYTTTVERARRKDATANLTALHAAQKIRFSELALYYPSTATTVNVNAINTNLKLNIIEQGLTYQCTGTNGSTFTCTATRTSPAWIVSVTEAVLSGTNPSCSGACP